MGLPPGDDKSMRIAFMVKGQPKFKQVSQDTPIQSIIQELLDADRIKENSEDYALIYQIDNNRVKHYRIVTEKNRGDMHGKIIELGESPNKSSKRIIDELQKKTPDQKDLNKALKDLSHMSVDATFAKAFHSYNGLNIILSEVAGSKFREAELGIVLEGVNLLVEHMVEMDNMRSIPIQQEFIKQLADLTTRDGEPALVLALGKALNLLAILVRECEEIDIGMFVALPNLISLLKHASIERRGDMVTALQERTARSYILEHLVGAVSASQVKGKDGEGLNSTPWADDMSHQLYLLQHYILSQVKTRLDTKIEPQDSEALQMIKDLRSTAFDTGSPSPKNNTRYAQDYKKLGFDSHLDPSLDFQVTPPGILALDCMDHFAKTHQEQFMKVVLENS